VEGPVWEEHWEAPAGGLVAGCSPGYPLWGY